MAKVISAVFPKGGEWKSTFIQTVCTSSTFSEYRIGMLEADSQNSISDWVNERAENKEIAPLDIHVFKYDSKQSLKSAIERYTYDVDYLFIDLPGESVSAELTRSALAYSDLCVTPMRASDKAIRAFENNFLPILQVMVDLRGIDHYYLLPTFAHSSTKIENHRNIFMPYKECINITKSIHRDRQLFTYFSQGGMTLLEYSATLNKDSKEYTIAYKSMEEIETIAKEIFNIIQKL